MSPIGAEVHIVSPGEFDAICAVEMAKGIDASMAEEVHIIPSAGQTLSGAYGLLQEILAPTSKRLVFWQMDEYVTRAQAPESSFKNYLLTNVIRGNPRASLRPIPLTEVDLRHHEAKMPAIDFAWHGIGVNGHIGFNEPGSAFASHGRFVELCDSTLAANFANREQRKAHRIGATLGLSTLRKAKQSYLFARGVHKAEGIRRMLRGPIAEDCPATALRDVRSPVKVYLDEAAASLI